MGSNAITMSIIVTLTDEEMEVAAHEGVRRRLRNLRRGSQPVRGGLRTTPLNAPEQWKCDIEGAAAELAVSKLANRYWSALNQQGGADVGTWGVRHTPYDTGHLIVWDRDPDDRIMVLVTGTPPSLTVHGWIRAAEAKLPQYQRNDRPENEFWVPQSDLHPFVKARSNGERNNNDNLL